MQLGTLALLIVAAGNVAWAQTRPPTRYEVDRTPSVSVGGDGTGAEPLLESVFSATRTPQGFVVGESRTGILLFLDANGKLV